MNKRERERERERDLSLHPCSHCNVYYVCFGGEIHCSKEFTFAYMLEIMKVG